MGHQRFAALLVGPKEVTLEAVHQMQTCGRWPTPGVSCGGRWRPATRPRTAQTKLGKSSVQQASPTTYTYLVVRHLLEMILLELLKTILFKILHCSRI